MPPSDSEKTRLEIEVALRDSFSSGMKNVTRELDNANRKALELGGVGAKGFNQLNEGIKTTSRSMEVLNATTMVLSRAFIGPIGLAAGLYQVSEMLEKVAVSSLQMRNFATNTGFSTRAVEELQQAGRRMGMTLQESTSAIQNLGSKLDNLEAFKEGSELYQAFSKGPGGVEFAKRMKEIAQSGDRLKVVGEITETYGRQSDHAKTLIAGLFGVTKSYFEFLSEARSHNIKVFDFPEGASKKFIEYQIAFEVKLDEIWKRIAGHGITAMNQLSESLNTEGITAKRIADTINLGITAVIDQIKNEIRDITAIVNAFSKVPENFKEATGIGRFPQGGDPVDDSPAKPRIQFLKKNHLHNPFSNPNITGGEGLNELGGNAGKDGLNVLVDIRDSLQRIELSGGEGGGRTYGTGARGGGLQAGVGGFRPFPGGGTSGGGTSGGGIRGALAGRRGTTGGNAAAAAAAGGGADDGAVANAAGAAGGGINRDKWLNALENDPAMKDKLFRHSLGENTDPMANQAIMETAANRADIRGVNRFDEKGNLSYFQGYYRGHITPKMRAMLESNYNKVFREGSDVSKGAIDNSSSWLSAKHARTGAFRETANFGGDRITGHSGVETFQIPGTQESGRGERARYPEFRRRQLEEAAQRREQFDKSQSMAGGGMNGKINASVDFKNVPPGVSTSAGVEGDVFKDLQIKKTRQGGVYREMEQAYE